MAKPTIEWGTKTINVPQSYLVLQSGSVYTIDTNQFHLDLRELEASSDGVVFVSTHKHNTTVTLSGITYARTVEIINGYTITFEVGNYAVVLEKSNNNIIDVMNFNGVSVLGNNSAGLIDAELIATQTFEVHKVLGLNKGDKVTITPDGIVSESGDIIVEFTGDGVNSTTMQRQ